MRAADHIEQAWSNLWKKRLRTFLTTAGVVIGVGALICMFAFAQGIQANLRREFNEMGLFNYITISTGTDYARRTHHDPDDAPDVDAEDQPVRKQAGRRPPLDVQLVKEISQIKGVEAVFPEMRFPAQVRLGKQEQFTFVQVLTAEACQSPLVQLHDGRPYKTDDPNELVISNTFLRRLGITDGAAAIGKQLEIRTLSFDFSLANLLKMVLSAKGGGLPISNTNYMFTVVGVAEKMGMRGGFIPVSSDVLIPPGPAEHMQKLELTSISDFFQPADKSGTYSTLSVKVDSPTHVTAVEDQLRKRGLRTFALIHQLNQAERMFIIMDMFILAVGMIGITVASLGIVNTMVMSILERYREIGVMKAVGATDGDVQKIFLFESGMIGLLGGLGGLLLAWLVSLLINTIINAFASREGMPYMHYFNFPWWVCLGGIFFSILISLIAGIYPTRRAARVDPVVALRHD
jgi:ABC-type lipoprotein release transport system permease subunit